MARRSILAGPPPGDPGLLQDEVVRALLWQAERAWGSGRAEVAEALLVEVYWLLDHDLEAGQVTRQ